MEASAWPRPTQSIPSVTVGYPRLPRLCNTGTMGVCNTGTMEARFAFTIASKGNSGACLMTVRVNLLI